MFRDNKREIFGFRKYKAYGLASAVIAAFFLMSGVASADEVTKPTNLLTLLLLRLHHRQKLLLIPLHLTEKLLRTIQL